MRPHHRLEAWRKSMDFVFAVYQATDSFPKEEKFGLTSQLKGGSFGAGEPCGGRGQKLKKRVRALHF